MDLSHVRLPLDGTEAPLIWHVLRTLASLSVRLPDSVDHSELHLSCVLFFTSPSLVFLFALRYSSNMRKHCTESHEFRTPLNIECEQNKICHGFEWRASRRSPHEKTIAETASDFYKHCSKKCDNNIGQNVCHPAKRTEKKSTVYSLNGCVCVCVSHWGQTIVAAAAFLVDCDINFHDLFRSRIDRISVYSWLSFFFAVFLSLSLSMRCHRAITHNTKLLLREMWPTEERIPTWMPRFVASYQSFTTHSARLATTRLGIQHHLQHSKLTV